MKQTFYLVMYEELHHPKLKPAFKDGKLSMCFLSKSNDKEFWTLQDLFNIYVDRWELVYRKLELWNEINKDLISLGFQHLTEKSECIVTYCNESLKFLKEVKNG